MEGVEEVKLVKIRVTINDVMSANLCRMRWTQPRQGKCGSP